MSDTNVARSSAWMALGTIVSRLTGFARLYLLAFTIGTHLNADLFSNANTIPNTLYILVAGGIFNVVLVPQMVRAMKRDPDGGDAYVNRVMTLGLLVLAGATVLLVLVAPLVVQLVFPGELFTARHERQLASAQLLVMLCMPQVFFYGAFVLIGQVLNSRGVFGPMMWAPIANNLVAISVLGVYLAAFGSSDEGAGFSTSQAALLGAGSTFGIAVQAALLVPYLRRAGFRFRPRFDFRDSGLGHTLRLGGWTLGFIIANQVAYIVVQRLGVTGNLRGGVSGDGAGSAVYEIGYLMSQVPHGVVTVSLATAIIPTLSALAADREYGQLARELSRVLRLVLAVIAPVAVAAAVLAPIGIHALAFGGVRANAGIVGLTVAAFAPAMVAFAIHYVMLRGYYAMENTRVPFFIQLVVAVTNIAAAISFTRIVQPQHVPLALALAFGLSYAVGATLSATLLRRSAPVLDADFGRFALRLTGALVVTAGVMVAALAVVQAAGIPTDAPARALGVVALIGPLGAGTYLVASRLLGLTELASVVAAVRRRS